MQHNPAFPTGDARPVFARACSAAVIRLWTHNSAISSCSSDTSSVSAHVKGSSTVSNRFVCEIAKVMAPSNSASHR